MGRCSAHVVGLEFAKFDVKTWAGCMLLLGRGMLAVPTVRALVADAHGFACHAWQLSVETADSCFLAKQGHKVTSLHLAAISGCVPIFKWPAYKYPPCIVCG